MTATKGIGHGGARPGAGRKPKPPQLLDLAVTGDPKEFLAAVMNDRHADARLRVDAAKALMPFVHQKLDAVRIKQVRRDAAQSAAGGRFNSAARPPALKAVK